MKLVRFHNIVLVVPFLFAVSSPFLASAQDATTMPVLTTAVISSLRGATNEKDVATTRHKQADNSITNPEESPAAPVVSPVVEPVPPIEPVKPKGGIDIPGDKDGDKGQENNGGGDGEDNWKAAAVEGEQQVEGNKESWWDRFAWNNRGPDRGNPGHWYVEGEEGIKQQQQQMEGDKQQGRFAWNNPGPDRGNFGGWYVEGEGGIKQQQQQQQQMEGDKQRGRFDWSEPGRDRGNFGGWR